MIHYLTIALVLFTVAFMGFVVAPTVRKRHATAAEVTESAPKPISEPKVPRDTSRPYPRPKGGRRKQDSTCPVCGTGDTTGSLDGRVFGWRAHASCAEWLGDWKPAPPPFRPDRELIGYAERGQKTAAKSGSTNTVIFTGKGAITAGSAGGAGGVSSVAQMVQNGLMSANEARERLDREIVAAWGVPPLLLEEHTRKVGDPLPIERCPKCGARFCGTPDYLRMAYKTHLQLGCRQSADPGPI